MFFLLGFDTTLLTKRKCKTYTKQHVKINNRRKKYFEVRRVKLITSFAASAAGSWKNVPINFSRKLKCFHVSSLIH